MQSKIDEAHAEMRRAHGEKAKLEAELRDGQKQREQEVNLRLRFEEKLNNLHALNRTFQQLSVRNGAVLEQKTLELDEIYQKYDVEKELVIKYKAEAESLAQWKQLKESEIVALKATLEAAQVEAQNATVRARELEMANTS